MECHSSQSTHRPWSLQFKIQFHSVVQNSQPKLNWGSNYAFWRPRNCLQTLICHKPHQIPGQQNWHWCKCRSKSLPIAENDLWPSQPSSFPEPIPLHWGNARKFPWLPHPLMQTWNYSWRSEINWLAHFFGSPCQPQSTYHSICNHCTYLHM
jgi:hypothetical protein